MHLLGKVEDDVEIVTGQLARFVNDVGRREACGERMQPIQCRPQPLIRFVFGHVVSLCRRTICVERRGHPSSDGRYDPGQDDDCDGNGEDSPRFGSAVEPRLGSAAIRRWTILYHGVSL